MKRKARRPQARLRDFSLRDYFAATVLNGLAAAGHIPFRTTHQTSMDDDEDRAYSASEIYRMADAMLAERDKR